MQQLTSEIVSNKSSLPTSHDIMYRHPETKHIKAKYSKDYNSKPVISQNLVDKIRELERV